MKIDKSKMLDSTGKPITQGLFLENSYSKFAMYTLKDEDFYYEKTGETLPSIRRLYLEMEDTLEYLFATEYFLNWKHWLRICDNKLMQPHVAAWREELELKLRSQAMQDMLKMSSDGSYQATKMILDRSWNKNAVGRPSKADKERSKRVEERIHNEFADDIDRLKHLQ